jgi:hypothetical protein
MTTGQYVKGKCINSEFSLHNVFLYKGVDIVYSESDGS